MREYDIESSSVSAACAYIVGFFVKIHKNVDLTLLSMNKTV